MKETKTGTGKKVTRKIKAVISAFVFMIVSMFICPLTALAADETGGGGEFMELNEKLKNTASYGKYIVIGVAACAIVIVGLCFILPVRRLNEFAKEHVLSIVIGVGLVILATSIATGIAGMF